MTAHLAPASRLDALAAAHPLATWRRPAWLICALLGAALVWSHFAKLDEVAIAPAEVVPQGQVKVIQHLEGGIIEQIMVREGQPVARGTPLVQLDLGLVAANREDLQVQLAALGFKRTRLLAEANNQKLEVSVGGGGDPRLADVLRGERDAYDSRRRQLDSTLAVLMNQQTQREQEVKETEAKRAATEANLRIARQRLALARDLVAQDLISKLEHLDRQRDVEILQGQLAELEQSLPRVRAALAEVQNRANEEISKYRRQAAEELGQVELQIARTREVVAKMTDQARRTQIESPIDGVVKNLRFHTIGGVVKPGDPIMDIVPSNDSLVIEGRVAPVDVGYVSVGQRAVVKVTTYDFVRYGGLEGEVTVLAPDATSDRTGKQYFRVVVQTDKSYLGNGPAEYPISPGMEATIDIHTGEKSVLEYLVSPVLKLKHEAFRER